METVWRRLISKADSSTKDEIERLIAGETIVKSIRLDLTYDEIESTIDNMWVCYSPQDILQRQEM